MDKALSGVSQAMNRDEILREIRRTAAANGGVPLGADRLKAETGITQSDWKKCWARLSDAHREVGLVPNQFGSKAYEQTFLLERYAGYARELGHLPTKDEIRIKCSKDRGFPSAGTYFRGRRKLVLVEQLLKYCRSQKGYEDVIRMCDEYIDNHRQESEDAPPAQEEIGFVYLMKSGRFCKIGRSDAPGRREYEVAIQLPEKLKTIHTIRTDDPVGIEAYWHKRFEAKRAKGEWFALSAADVAAFKKRKFM